MLLYDEKKEKETAEIDIEEHGLNKGISQGIKQTAKNMLERNMNIDVVLRNNLVCL